MYPALQGRLIAKPSAGPIFILQAALNPSFFVCGVLFVYRSLSADSMSLLCNRRV